jgi:hypothetical protein
MTTVIPGSIANAQPLRGFALMIPRMTVKKRRLSLL